MNQQPERALPNWPAADDDTTRATQGSGGSCIDGVHVNKVPNKGNPICPQDT